MKMAKGKPEKKVTAKKITRFKEETKIEKKNKKALELIRSVKGRLG